MNKEKDFISLNLYLHIYEINYKFIVTKDVKMRKKENYEYNNIC